MKICLIAATTIIFLAASIATAQDEPGKTHQEVLPWLTELNDPTSNPRFSQPERTVQKNNFIEEWKNGDHSPDQYKVSSVDDDETRLMKQRINVALMELEHFKQLSDSGTTTLDVTFRCLDRLLAAKLEFHTKPTEIVSAWSEALEFAKAEEAIVLDNFNAGANVNIQQVAQATFNRLDIEIRLLRAKKALREK